MPVTEIPSKLVPATHLDNALCWSPPRSVMGPGTQRVGCQSTLVSSSDPPTPKWAPYHKKYACDKGLE